jgi:Cys-tRNA(Pro)/Cys-tRNA(Cys) deacylase
MSTPPVSAILTDLNVPHRIFVHPGPIESLEQAASERGHAMVLVAGPGRVSWKTLRETFNRSRLTMAPREEVLAVTGYPIGAVAPFGLPDDLPILVDAGVAAHDEISIGSGVRGTTIILRSADLLQALGDPPLGAYLERER